MSGKFPVHVQYCGGWGYKRYYNALVIALDDEFGSDVLACTFTMDPGATGNFEVSIGADKKLIHSKATGGKGRCESQAEKDAVFAAIREAMGK